MNIDAEIQSKILIKWTQQCKKIHHSQVEFTQEYKEIFYKKIY